MNAVRDTDNDLRVLILAPTAKDAQITAGILRESGVNCNVCRHIGEVTAEIEKGAGAAIITEEYLLSDRSNALGSILAQ